MSNIAFYEPYQCPDTIYNIGCPIKESLKWSLVFLPDTNNKKKSWRQTVADLHAKDALKYRITELCVLFDKSKQAYYQYDEERALSRVAASSFAMEYARRIRGSDPGMGIMKIWYMYRHEFRNEDYLLGRDAFTDLLANEGMKVRNKVRKPRTTDSTHGLPVFPNIVKDFIPTSPNQLWVSDITYIPIWLSDEDYVFCYLSLILDAYSKEIVGWSIGDSLKAVYPLEALNMALRRIEGMEHNLTHHSDRGVQYASSEYIKMLKDRGIRISMTETGDPKDNSQAERINNTMKNELLKDYGIPRYRRGAPSCCQGC